MASEMGLGSCMITKDDGTVCGLQINEGEPIGTVMSNGPKVGHQRCAAAFIQRQREKDALMAKIAAQQGPGGPVDPDSGKDAIEGSIPLQTPPALKGTPSLSDVVLPEGVRPVSDLPMREPIDTWEHSGPPGGKVVRDPDGEGGLIVLDADPRPFSMPLKVSDEPLTEYEKEIIRQFRSGELTPKLKSNVNPVRADIDNRFTYHAPSNDQAQRYVMLREMARSLAHMILDQCPDSRERALALTHLDQVVMFANAAIARHS